MENAAIAAAPAAAAAAVEGLSQQVEAALGVLENRVDEDWGDDDAVPQGGVGGVLAFLRDFYPPDDGGGPVLPVPPAVPPAVPAGVDLHVDGHGAPSAAYTSSWVGSTPPPNIAWEASTVANDVHLRNFLFEAAGSKVTVGELTDVWDHTSATLRADNAYQQLSRGDQGVAMGVALGVARRELFLSKMSEADVEETHRLEG